MPRFELEVVGAEEIDPGITLVSPARQREFGVEANDRKIGEHGAKDYP